MGGTCPNRKQTARGGRTLLWIEFDELGVSKKIDFFEGLEAPNNDTLPKHEKFSVFVDPRRCARANEPVVPSQLICVVVVVAGCNVGSAG